MTQRKKIAKRTALLIAEEMTMRELRKARQMTQVEMAKSLGGKAGADLTHRKAHRHAPVHTAARRQSYGRRADSYLTFPDGAPVKLTGFAAIEA